MTQRKDDRIVWVDNLKALGILAIFCGHMGQYTGYLYEFVFTFHVPLFSLLLDFLQVKMKN